MAAVKETINPCLICAHVVSLVAMRWWRGREKRFIFHVLALSAAACMCCCVRVLLCGTLLCERRLSDATSQSNHHRHHHRHHVQHLAAPCAISLILCRFWGESLGRLW